MRRRCACVAVAIAMVAVSGCRQNQLTRSSPRAGDYHIAILLLYAHPLEPKADDCESLTVPSYLTVATKDKITWDIVNLCGNTKDISVTKFEGENNPAHKDPVEQDGVSDPKRRLKYKVKGDADLDVYKYQVYRDGVAIEDPEIYVER